MSDLGCDILINELTAEEVRGLEEEEEEDRTTHSRTPAPSTASEASKAEDELEQIIIYEAPQSGEQELAELAESLHISAHPSIAVMATQTQTVPAGTINPVTGRMMTEEEIAINRAIGPDRNDPPEGSPPRGPFQGNGGNPGGGGGRGFPHGGGGPEEDHQDHQEVEERPEEDTTMEGTEDRISWWETLQKYSREYERKLSLSLLFGGSMQALTVKTPPSPMHTRRASYSSRTFKGTMWQNGSNK